MNAEVDDGHGQHGARRRSKVTLYGERLREKQTLKYFYHMGDAQCQRIMSIASKTERYTVDKLNQLLERRLDHVLRRAASARTIWQARQIVTHGHVRVNGHKVDRPSYLVQLNDVVAYKPKKKEV